LARCMQSRAVARPDPPGKYPGDAAFKEVDLRFLLG
jgi:hypothetical protein